MTALDAPEREAELRRTLRRKSALNRFYRQVYEEFRSTLLRCPAELPVLEIGSGGGFIKDIVPNVLTSDFIAYRHIDLQFDARQMPFAEASVGGLFMFNVFHHIPDVARFLAEVERVLAHNGILLIVDQYPSVLSRPIYRHLHHEPFDPEAADWSFASAGPLSGANGALAWIVFERDRSELFARYPGLTLRRFEPHSPLSYWLAGGLKPWTLIPGFLFGAIRRLDHMLASLTRRSCSFVTIELQRER